MLAAWAISALGSLVAARSVARRVFGLLAAQSLAGIIDFLVLVGVEHVIAAIALANFAFAISSFGARRNFLRASATSAFRASPATIGFVVQDKGRHRLAVQAHAARWAKKIYTLFPVLLVPWNHLFRLQNYARLAVVWAQCGKNLMPAGCKKNNGRLLAEPPVPHRPPCLWRSLKLLLAINFDQMRFISISNESRISVGRLPYHTSL